MQVRHWHHTIMGLVLVGGLAAAGFTQDTPVTGTTRVASAAAGRGNGNRGRNGQGSFGFLASLERIVGLTPEQRDAVRGLLAEQRQQSQALREQTDTKIRALLNVDQQKKFDAMLAEQKERRARKGQSA